ncbi:hypothetical protein OIU77_009910 [Salix suchowensis]|uniref:Uncharacterized protein n=1 Tax=Salix suchowensis TaxID=1278906 RepID=A0ABQ9A8S2_9ROSI|nr:hypothetical protein OIU77_009910 [Salix suchowensis]
MIKVTFRSKLCSLIFYKIVYAKRHPFHIVPCYKRQPDTCLSRKSQHSN